MASLERAENRDKMGIFGENELVTNADSTLRNIPAALRQHRNDELNYRINYGLINYKINCSLTNDSPINDPPDKRSTRQIKETDK